MVGESYTGRSDMAVKISTGLPNCREGRQNPIGSVTLEGMLRVARLADELGYGEGWIDSTQQPEQLRTHAEQLYKLARDVGRGDASFEIARQFYVSIASTEAEARANYAAAAPPPPGGQAAEAGRPAA